ncbi:4Fe-4S binding protein [Helicobacter monodelphidis]|uniref:4Fe-4S binding protein n=1 Tax=Helicobacter sp. 15-1451 TaxID=2004995 RepID=UPI001C66991D|nr:4Fe-4S binding protein [Helicobacter sp. 15-1451]
MYRRLMCAIPPKGDFRRVRHISNAEQFLLESQAEGVKDGDGAIIREDNIRSTSVLAPTKKIILRIELCLAWNKTLCYACKDICQENAITFNGGLFYPEIILSQCTFCGDCIPKCPTNAIIFEECELKNTPPD